MSQYDESLVLAIDQGTHASRALVVDRRGRIVVGGAEDVRIVHPRADEAEQDAEELVASVLAAARTALAALGGTRRAVAAAGLACQRSTCLCWDRGDGRPLSPAFSWQDRRGHAEVAGLAPHGEAVHRKTGLYLSPHYGATKLRWALDHLPAVRQAMQAGTLAWGPLESFLGFRLLKERPLLVDPHCAARTQLFSLATRDWDPELLALFGVPPGFLPRCVPTCHDWGTLELGDLAIPLKAANGDQPSAVFAFGWPEADSAYVNIGTSAYVQRALDRDPGYVPRMLTGTLLDDDAGTAVYMLEGNVNGAGSALDWLAGELALDDLIARLPQWLEQPGEPPLFLNGIGGLGAPFWNPGFDSRFVGAGGPGEKAVAVVESTAFLLQANLDHMARHVPAPRRIRVSGGVSRLDGLCRRIAALSGLPVLRREDPEATARGIAYLAAGRPAEWNHGAPEQAFAPEPDAAIRARYQRWRALMDGE